MLGTIPSAGATVKVREMRFKRNHPATPGLGRGAALSSSAKRTRAGQIQDAGTEPRLGAHFRVCVCGGVPISRRPPPHQHMQGFVFHTDGHQPKCCFQAYAKSLGSVLLAHMQKKPNTPTRQTKQNNIYASIIIN